MQTVISHFSSYPLASRSLFHSLKLDFIVLSLPINHIDWALTSACGQAPLQIYMGNSLL